MHGKYKINIMLHPIRLRFIRRLIKLKCISNKINHVLIIGENVIAT